MTLLPDPSPAPLCPLRRRAARRGAATTRATGLAVPLVVLLAGCAATPGTVDRSAGAPAAAEASTDGSTFPLTLENCGVTVTVEEPPERIVAIKSSAIEVLLALGVEDRVIGIGFPDGPAPQEYADAAARLPMLSDKVPAAEVVLEQQPDLVYAGWESNLTAEGAGDRARLADLGVATYVSPSACKDPAHRPDRLTFEEVFAEVTEVATLLGVPSAATELVAEQQAALDTLEPDDRGLTALWYSSGDDIPYVGAGIGAPQMLMDAVGLTNIAGGVADTWASFSWEQVAQDDPDVIVLVDATWNSAAQKRERLATSPATANLTAVIEERYLVVPFPATEAGVRNVDAALDLSAQLAELDLEPAGAGATG